jgi:ribosomal protein S18 acetylase RimI-like enzyme
MIAIEQAHAEDWQVWRDLRLRALATDPDAFGSTLAEWQDADEPRWRDGFATVLFRAIAVVDGRPSGMIGCRESSAGTDPAASPGVEIVSVWVSRSVRGRGVGDALIAAALRWAARDRPDRTVLLQVREANAAAIALYRRNGFVDDGPAAERRPGGPPERRMVRRHGGPEPRPRPWAVARHDGGNPPIDP